MDDNIDPQLEKNYKVLYNGSQLRAINDDGSGEECELPLLDIKSLNVGQFEREKCIKEIGKAAREWGFFQVLNHGIPHEITEILLDELKKVFNEPFNKKSKDNFLNLSANSYRWGNPKATRLGQLAWSEAFHIPVTDISRMDGKQRLSCRDSTRAQKAYPLVLVPRQKPGT